MYVLIGQVAMQVRKPQRSSSITFHVLQVEANMAKPIDDPQQGIRVITLCSLCHQNPASRGKTNL